MIKSLNRILHFFIYSTILFFLLATYVSCNSLTTKRVLKNPISFTKITEAREFLERLEIYLKTILDLIQRNRMLAVQSANGVYMEEDVLFQEILKEICRIRESAHFKNEMLFETEGPPSRNMSLQIDAHSSAIRFPLPELAPEKIGISSCDSKNFKSKINVKTPDFAIQSLNIIDKALSIVSFELYRVGVLSERLDHSQRLQESLDRSEQKSKQNSKLKPR
ncbi:endoflagellar protein [Leptospira sp. WS92.C1]